MVNSLISEVIIDKEMGYSRGEFVNQFKLFAIEFNYTLNKNSIVLFPERIDALGKTKPETTKPENIAQLTITFTEQTDRMIGSLSIPRLFVNFHFLNYTELQYKQFMHKFDLSFQRGGG